MYFYFNRRYDLRIPSRNVPSTTWPGIPNPTVAQALEPEYIAVDSTGTYAYITIQEANAIAVLDIANANITKLVDLPKKRWSGLGIDPSSRDGGYCEFISN